MSNSIFCTKYVTGGIAVSQMMLIDQAKGLFHRVISQSGHSLSLGFIRSRDAIKTKHKSLLESMGVYYDSLCHNFNLPSIFYDHREYDI